MNEIKNEELKDFSNSTIEFKQKIIGVLFKPVRLFSSLKKSDLKFTDWLISPLLVILLYAIIRYFPTFNSDIKTAYIERSQIRYEKYLNTQLTEGKMTKDSADVLMKDYRLNSETYLYKGAYILSMNKLWTTTALFILITAAWFLIFKFVFKENPSYKFILSSFGLTYYILVLQMLILLIGVLFASSIFSGLTTYTLNVNLNTVFTLPRNTYWGHLLERMDPFLIWFYTVLGIAFTKTFKPKNSKKYYILVFALWLSADLIFYLLYTFEPYFRFFIFY
jgi:hypothetical protein